MAVMSGNDVKVQQDIQANKKPVAPIKKKLNKKEQSPDDTVTTSKIKKQNDAPDKFKSPKLVLALIDSKLSEA